MNILSPVPFWARWAALGALCLAVAVFTALKVSEHYQVQESAEHAALAQSSADSLKIVAQQKEKQNAVTQVVETHYRWTVAGIDRVLVSADSNQHMPAIADSAGLAASSVQSQNACGIGRTDPCTVGRIFYNNALKDAAVVDAYGDWVKDIGFNK